MIIIIHNKVIIKIVLILIVLIIFKDKLASYLLDKKFKDTFGKLNDNIMSMNFEEFDEVDSQNLNEEVQEDKLQHPTQF